jgi:hypothetical protein
MGEEGKRQNLNSTACLLPMPPFLLFTFGLCLFTFAFF